MDDGRILRGTTPEIVIRPKAVGLDFSQITGVELTFCQGKILLIKGSSDCTVKYHFLESETLAFDGSKNAPPVEVQLRFKIGEEIVGTGEGIIRFKDLLSNKAFDDGE